MQIYLKNRMGKKCLNFLLRFETNFVLTRTFFSKNQLVSLAIESPSLIRIFCEKNLKLAVLETVLAFELAAKYLEGSFS